jgi:2-polyprenyl-6-methoxyphenol hydroxylase-like FAD-dependent oxidoreductase
LYKPVSGLGMQSLSCGKCRSGQPPPQENRTEPGVETIRPDQCAALTTCCAFRRGTDNDQGASEKRAPAVLNVEAAGGGPVGLAFAILLRNLMGDGVRLRIWDRRWVQRGQRVVWRGRREGNNRRRQVVTLQSNVWSMLPSAVRQRVFAEQQILEVWPYGPDSPTTKGRPRNLRIRGIEDCLLALAQDCGIELVPETYVLPERWDGLDVLAICDGAQSQTRAMLRQHFGTPSRDFYSIDGRPLDEAVLGLEVQSDLPDEWTVPLTVCQNRFLFNPRRGRGFINMRLTQQEAAEVVGITGAGPTECIQRHPCVMERRGSGFVCQTHNAVFKPSADALSFLWPRILDGLRFFGVAPQNLLSITSFRLGMEHHPRFTAQLAPRSFGALLGDAACSIHFWPGRGLNTGLKSAVSLARCLKSRWRGTQLRVSDLARHEGLMHQLQFREKSRAWTIMAMPDEHGVPRVIAERIQAGLKGPFNRRQLQAVLCERMQTVASRMEGRMGPLPNKDWFFQRLIGLDDSTLKVLVETQPWITSEVGGEEVSVDEVFPPEVND